MQMKHQTFSGIEYLSVISFSKKGINVCNSYEVQVGGRLWTFGHPLTGLAMAGVG